MLRPTEFERIETVSQGVYTLRLKSTSQDYIGVSYRKTVLPGFVEEMQTCAWPLGD